MFSKYLLNKSLVKLAMCLVLGLSLGCIRNQYQFGLGNRIPPNYSDTLNPISIGQGTPCLDTMENIVQGPHRFVRRLLGFKVLSPEEVNSQRWQAVASSQEYLMKNGLQDVYIDVQVYDPGQQWNRIKANPRISPFWKYTGGPLQVLGYSLLPGRVFHWDYYDAFSNTLSINSEDQGLAMLQAANAKTYRSRPSQGTYAMLQYAPILPVIHQVETTSDLLTYARYYQRPEFEHMLYPIVYADIGAYTLSEATWFLPGSGIQPIITDLTVSAIGGAVGASSGYAMAAWDERNASRMAAIQRGELYGYARR